MASVNAVMTRSEQFHEVEGVCFACIECDAGFKESSLVAGKTPFHLKPKIGGGKCKKGLGVKKLKHPR